MQDTGLKLFMQGRSKKQIADALKIDKEKVEKLLVAAMRESKGK